MYIGVQDMAFTGAERGWANNNIACIRDNGVIYGDGNVPASGMAESYTEGDLLSFAFDA